MKQIIFFIFLILTPAVSNAQELNEAFSKAYDTALVIYNRSSGEVINADPVLSARRLSPCSTFKIYNTLIGLEMGLIQDADTPWYRWDGIHRDIEGWNQDLTLREAFRVSAVPAYQILARQIGNERMKKYVEQINFHLKGNCRIKTPLHFSYDTVIEGKHSDGNTNTKHRTKQKA
jgi:beta-lactamase class D